MTSSTDFADNGWDVRARLVDGWVERMPRRREVVDPLRREVRRAAWLAPQLPVAIPQPEVVTEDPLRVRHRLVPGSPCDGSSRVQGEQVGRFLAALHSVPVVAAIEHGARSAEETIRDRQHHRNDFASIVVPRVPVELRADALRLLVRLSQASYTVALTHGDLGPEHIRVQGGHVSGIIDWTDAAVGDPALDLAWVLWGASPDFAAGVRAAYPVTDDLTRRSRDWHLLGPWYEVLYGVQTDQPDYVRSGLAGVVARLRL